MAEVAAFELGAANSRRLAIVPFQTFESPPLAKGPDSLYCQKLKLLQLEGRVPGRSLAELGQRAIHSGQSPNQEGPPVQ